MSFSAGGIGRHLSCTCAATLSDTPTHRKIFPHVSPEAVEVPIEGSALDRIRQKRAEQELSGD
jgi:hypothetical protein